MHAAFERFFSAADAAGAAISTRDRVAITTAAAEIAANIVDYACHELTDAEVTLVLSRLGDTVEARFEDPGIPYGEAVPMPDNPIPHLGLGLEVARASVHALEYTRTGSTNRWLLARRTDEVGR
jgi:anti-sigma regulatory factor (Ser/Thr protein kinase)